MHVWNKGQGYGLLAENGVHDTVVNPIGGICLALVVLLHSC